MNDEMNRRVMINVVEYFVHTFLDDIQQMLDEKKKLRDQLTLERKVNERLIKSDRIDYTLYLKQIYSL